MDIAQNRHTIRHRRAQFTQRRRDEGGADAVIISANAMFGDHDRQARRLMRIAHSAGQGGRIDLGASPVDHRPLGRRQSAIFAPDHPFVILEPQKIIAMHRLCPRAIQHRPHRIARRGFGACLIIKHRQRHADRRVGPYLLDRSTARFMRGDKVPCGGKNIIRVHRNGRGKFHRPTSPRRRRQHRSLRCPNLWRRDQL